jgi:hypothetical protein
MIRNCYFWQHDSDQPVRLNYPLLVVEDNTSLYTVCSPPCKGVSIESVCDITQRVDHDSREFHLEDDGTHMWSTSRKGRPNLVRETLATCDRRELDSGRCGPTRSRGEEHPPDNSEKRSMSAPLSLLLFKHLHFHTSILLLSC